MEPSIISTKFLQGNAHITKRILIPVFLGNHPRFEDDFTHFGISLHFKSKCKTIQRFEQNILYLDKTRKSVKMNVTALRDE